MKANCCSTCSLLDGHAVGSCRPSRATSVNQGGHPSHSPTAWKSLITIKFLKSFDPNLTCYRARNFPDFCFHSVRLIEVHSDTYFTQLPADYDLYQSRECLLALLAKIQSLLPLGCSTSFFETFAVAAVVVPRVFVVHTGWR